MRTTADFLAKTADRYGDETVIVLADPKAFSTRMRRKAENGEVYTLGDLRRDFTIQQSPDGAST